MFRDLIIMFGSVAVLVLLTSWYFQIWKAYREKYQGMSAGTNYMYLLAGSCLSLYNWIILEDFWMILLNVGITGNHVIIFAQRVIYRGNKTPKLS